MRVKYFRCSKLIKEYDEYLTHSKFGDESTDKNIVKFIKKDWYHTDHDLFVVSRVNYSL